MSSELQSNSCNACGGEKIRHITFPLGHQAKECLQCGLVWSNVELCFEQLYDSAYKKSDDSFTYNKYLKHYERLKCGDRADLIWFEKDFLKRKIKQPKGRLLEVGCSVGRFLLACKRADWHVSGIDISKQAVKLARELMPNDDIRLTTLTDELWPPETFDSIVFWEVIEHMGNPFETLCIARKLLKNGGELVLSTPDWDSWFIRHHPQENYWPPIHIWFFTEMSMRLLLKKAGMTAVSVQRKPIPWGETKWPIWKRIFALPWLFWLGIILRQGGGRFVITAKKA